MFNELVMDMTNVGWYLDKKTKKVNIEHPIHFYVDSLWCV
jgi:hypothetical protein